MMVTPINEAAHQASFRHPDRVSAGRPDDEDLGHLRARAWSPRAERPAGLPVLVTLVPDQLAECPYRRSPGNAVLEPDRSWRYRHAQAQGPQAGDAPGVLRPSARLRP